VLGRQKYVDLPQGQPLWQAPAEPDGDGELNTFMALSFHLNLSGYMVWLGMEPALLYDHAQMVGWRSLHYCEVLCSPTWCIMHHSYR